jgi:nitrate/nitrite-specific signal transduction histidine kinase
VKAGTIEKVRTRPVIGIDASWVAIAHSSKKAMLPFEYGQAIANFFVLVVLMLMLFVMDLPVIIPNKPLHHVSQRVSKAYLMQ